MGKKVKVLVLSCFVITALLLSSCASGATKTTTSTTPPLSTATTNSVSGNWWNSLGKPQYGGTMTLRLGQDVANFDPISNGGLITIMSAWMERMFTDDWTLNPTVFSYTIGFRPNDYVKGQLAESWEFSNPTTIVIHLRQGIHWQNIPPANGREFTADDVAFHFDRMFGLGDGFTQPSPFAYQLAIWTHFKSVAVIDRYTVSLGWDVANTEMILELVEAGVASTHCIENPEAVKQWGDVTDWHHAIGTGPFILQEFISGSSATLIKNPNYWGYDERYPQNKLPYVDGLNILIIPDDATAIAGLRTGKIDVMDSIPFAQAGDLQKSNPEILQIKIPQSDTPDLDLRNDTAPFNDIRVRQALQMAIDLPTIAATYYNGTCPPYPSTLTSQYMTGWGFPYQEWPQDLKDQYAYNPTAAEKLLADAGYPKGFNTDIVVDNACDMALLQIVKSYFNAIGVNMEIRPMDSAQLVNLVFVNQSYDQMVERATNSLGESYEPLMQFSRFSFPENHASDYLMVRDPVYDAFGTKALAATSTDEVKTLLKDCSEYVAEHHFCISLVQPNFFGLYHPWLHGYNGQYLGISGPSGPSLLFFYPARFWIDHSLSK